MKNANIDGYTVKYLAQTHGIPRPSLITAIARGKLTAAKLSDIWIVQDDDKLKTFLERYERRKEK